MTEQVADPPVTPPAPARDDEPTGDFVCPSCHRWFDKRSKRLAHVNSKHPEVTLK